MPFIDKDNLEKAAEKVFDRLNYFNDYTLQTIARRIKNIGKLSAYDQQTLKNMADISGDMKAITKKLAEITGQNIKDIEKIYEQTVSDGVNSYKPLYDFKNMKFTSFKQNEFAQQLAKHWFRETAGEMINLSRTKAIGFDKYNLKGEVIGHTPLEGAFQKAIDDAVIALSTGTVDFNTAMRETIKNLGGSGVKVTYGGGVNLSLSSMVRQNLLYGVKQAALAYDDSVGEELGCDGFGVDAHAGCRPKHEFMQGQMYSYDGKKTIDGVTYQDGAEALARLKDYGCLHFKTNVILGVSAPRYSQEELDRISRETTEPIEYDGKQKTLYEWKQAQRRIEREIRKEGQIRDMAKVSGDGTLVKNCNEKINAYRAKYDDMCKKVGLTPKYERMRTYVGNTSKIVDNGGKSGIININKDTINFSYPMKGFDNKSIREWYVANVGDIHKQIDTSKPLEEQARQAFDLRNKYRHIARIHMSDISTAKMLEKEYPSKTFDELLKEKMLRKGLTKQEALEDILKTSSKTNSSVNKTLGL